MALKNQDKGHYHLWDLPKGIFPRNKGNKAKAYAEDFAQLYKTLLFINTKVQESAQLCIFHIKSIKNMNDGYHTSPEKVFSHIDDFIYHYENFCHRVYAIREKFLKFINLILPVGYKDRQVRIEHMLINPIVKQTKLLSEIEKFNKRKGLGRIINDRKLMTHQLSYTDVNRHLFPVNKVKTLNKEGLRHWQKEITTRAGLVNKALSELDGINHETSDKIVIYKNI